MGMTFLFLRSLAREVSGTSNSLLRLRGVPTRKKSAADLLVSDKEQKTASGFCLWVGFGGGRSLKAGALELLMEEAMGGVGRKAPTIYYPSTDIIIHA